MPQHLLSLPDLLKATTQAFINADADANQSLTFEEFLNVVPEDVKATSTMESIREIFDSADTDGSGDISLDEYLYWALRWAAFDSGMATMFQNAFCKYDTSGNDELGTHTPYRTLDLHCPSPLLTSPAFEPLCGQTLANFPRR